MSLRGTFGEPALLLGKEDRRKHFPYRLKSEGAVIDSDPAGEILKTGFNPNEFPIEMFVCGMVQRSSQVFPEMVWYYVLY